MDYGISINDQTGVAEMSANAADYPLINKAFLSLEIPLGSFIGDTSFGSRLYQLKRAKATERTRKLAEDYALEASKWLLEEERAASIDVTAEYVTKANQKRLALYIEVTPPDNSTTVSYTTFIDVV